MKILLLIAVGLLGLRVLAQQQPPAFQPPVAGRAVSQSAEALTRFDLDFPGGTPKELVAAIQKAMDRPLNAIVPDEFADIALPALKMSNVNVQQLFTGLEQVSRKSQAVETGSYYGGAAYGQSYKSLQIVQTSYGFRPGSGNITDDTIWCFYAEKPALPPVAPAGGPGKTCRFYSLKPYLDQQVATVDDITTAIETGWKMLGESSPPKISFHKDTKLLIAVGEPNKLEIIDSVLKALDGSRTPSAAPGHASPPKPASRAKSAEPAKDNGGE